MPKSINMGNQFRTSTAANTNHAPRPLRSSTDTQQKVTIIGAGAAGFALAVDLKNHGVSVLVYSHSSHLRHANEVIRKGQLTARGKVQGVALPRITHDMGEAVAFSKIIILTVPSTGHHTILHEFRRFSLRQHTVIAVPGNLFSLIADMEIGCILETNLSPYSCRMEGEQLIVLGKKHSIAIAAFQRDLEPAVKETVQNLFSVELKWCSSVIEVCLLNINGIFHPLMMLMNAGRIESTGGDFFLYRDGLTRSVANAMKSLDQVRIKIGEAIGLRMKSALEVSNECYGHKFIDLVDLAQNSEPHRKLKAPPDLGNRNITEDIPDLLVCWHSLGEKLQIDVSPIKAVVTLVEMATGVQYFNTGRNLRQLHLENASRDDLIRKFSPPQRK